MMAENALSRIKSFSDSEINCKNSKDFNVESQRPRSSSERLNPNFQETIVKSRNEHKITKQSFVNDETFEEIISSLRSFSVPIKQVTKDSDDEMIVSTDVSSNLGQQHFIAEEKEIPQNQQSLANKDNHFETAENDDRELQENGDATSNLQISSDKKILSQESEKMASYEMKGTEKTSPYPILERANNTSVGDNILGEPRCVALKKYTTDGDDDFELDFEMTADIEDEDDELLTEQQLQTTKKKSNSPPDPNDMFLDDDSDITEIKNISYVNLTSPKKGGKNWEYPSIEREEGELTPDLYSSTHSDVGESRDTSLKRTSVKESNLEFFNKVNRCFRHLEKEFSNMHVPRGSTRLVEYLRNMLCVVERMKRKLSILVESANPSHGRTSSSHKNKSFSQNTKNSRTSSREKEYKNESGNQKNNQHQQHLEEYRKKYSNDSSKNSMSQDLIIKEKEAKAKIEHLRRESANIMHEGSKKERLRIQSLFKRQMNMITQQIIKQNDQSKNPKYVKVPSARSRSQKHTQNRPNLDNLTTLEDMERFLELLKIKKDGKTASPDWIRNYQKKQILKFSTKKDNPVPRARTLPILLSGANEDEKKMPNSKNTTLIANACDGNVESEKQAEKSEETCHQKKKSDKKEQELDGILGEQPEKCNSNNSLSASEFSKSNSSKRLSSKEQNLSKDKTKSGKIDSDSKEYSAEGIEFRSGENASSSKEVIDSSLVKRNSKEMERGETLFHSRASDFERDSREIFQESSKKRKRKKYSESKSSESDSDSRRDQILKKRKRNESGDNSLCKLSSAKPKKDTVSERKSRTRYHSGSEAVIDGFGEKIPEELRTKNIFIVSDKNLPLLDKHFCVKVKGNQIYLKKVGKIKKNRRHHSGEQRNSRHKSETAQERSKFKRIDEERASDLENSGSTLKEMEEFLQQLRSKKIPSREKQHDIVVSSQQSREMKFMARIQAKRKAKLMACVSATPNITEKEAKFLKDLENRSRNPCDSPDTQSKKQKLMEKIRAETDNIVLLQKQAAILEDDPLSDVKTFLNMIKEAESANDENAKQFYVSFSMKRSDVKQLENITTGKASAMSEESQRFLNSVRAKMRAKKTPGILINDFPKEKT